MSEQDKTTEALDAWAEIVKKKEGTTDDALAIWNELIGILKDGRVDAKEIPALLDVSARLLRAVTAILGVLAVDPRVGVTLGIVAGILDRASEGVKDQIPKIEQAWADIAGVLKDQRIKLKELPIFIEGVSNLIEVAIHVAAPFLTPEFGAAAATLAEKTARVIEIIKRFRPRRKRRRVKK
jgi:hypothetical protein